MDILKIQQRLNDLGYTIQPMFNNYGPKTTTAVKNFQKDNGLPITGIVDSLTYNLLFPYENNFLFISKDTIKKLIEFEVSSEAYYNKYLYKPHWPGGASGVTVGLGYDLGYHTKEEIKRDWGHYLSSANLDRLLKCAGLKSTSAKAQINSLVDIKITYDIAYKVFVEVSYPKYIKQALSIYPNLKNLHARAKGALISLVYNRGIALEGASRKEMKNLQKCVKETDYDCMVKEIKNMKRLWVGKGLNGLLSRRDWEALMCKTPLPEENNTNCIKIYY